METPQKALDLLRLEIAELRAARKRLVLNADEDRRAFERELHEGVQQQLVALAVGLQLADQQLATDPASAKALLAELARDAQQALDEASRLAEQLYPPVEPGRLAPSLRAAANGLGVRVSFGDATTSAPAEVARTVFLCCLAALERAGAGAHATITVRQVDAEVVFEIRDDGAGNPRPEGPLDRLRDRVEALGGSLKFESKPGAGAHVTGRLPFSR